MPPTSPDMVDQDALQSLCEQGSELLVRTDYLGAERLLSQAEKLAWSASDWDTLSRLYMPLQECRRQRRQRCGEGDVVLDLVARRPTDRLDAIDIVTRHSVGQLLVAGWGDVSVAAQVRQLAAGRGLYLETFLGAVYEIEEEPSPIVVILPTIDAPLPPASAPWKWDQLATQLPAGSRPITLSSLPVGVRKGNPATFAETMLMWERLHAPFLATADAESDLKKRMARYRETIAVDYACELAHQRLSAAAMELGRRGVDIG